MANLTINRQHRAAPGTATQGSERARAKEEASVAKTSAPTPSASVFGGAAKASRCWEAFGAEQAAAAPGRPSDLFTSAPFEMSQSGGVFPVGYGSAHPLPLVPGFEGFFEKLEVMALDPSGVHRTAQYELNDAGVLRPDSNQPPLGHNPYRLTLVGKDGSRWSGDVDVTPKKLGWSGAGYERVKVQLQREIPPPPRPPATIPAVPFQISQSGSVFPVGYGSANPKALVPGFEGFFQKMEVMALDQSGVHFTAEYSINRQGVVSPDCHQPPLGHNPYQVTLVGEDGSRWSAHVDVTPKKLGWSGAGYLDVAPEFHEVA